MAGCMNPKKAFCHRGHREHREIPEIGLTSRARQMSALSKQRVLLTCLCDLCALCGWIAVVRMNCVWGMMLAVATFVSCPIGAVAQEMRDPTRPSAHRDESGSAASSRVDSWVLQSVLISPERRFAIINGHVVAPGEWVNGALLLEVAEGSATLRTSEGRKMLNLYPRVTGRATRAQKQTIVQTYAESSSGPKSSFKSGSAGPQREP
jgi:MSHA biogenesis protein MshK